MATPRKKTLDPAAPSRWAKLRAEARAEYKPRPPYVFDGCEPAIEIRPPDSIEKLTAIAQIIDQNGDFDPANIRRLFEIFCGDAFPAVWAVVKDEPIDVFFALIDDMNSHFNAVPGEEGEDLPGGA